MQLACSRRCGSILFRALFAEVDLDADVKMFFALANAELDASMIPGYLQLGYVAAPGTLFKGVRKLPPGTLHAYPAGLRRPARNGPHPPALRKSPCSSMVRCLPAL